MYGAPALVYPASAVVYVATALVYVATALVHAATASMYCLTSTGYCLLFMFLALEKDFPASAFLIPVALRLLLPDLPVSLMRKTIQVCRQWGQTAT